jgi:hypothetical protein
MELKIQNCMQVEEVGDMKGLFLFPINDVLCSGLILHLYAREETTWET